MQALVEFYRFLCYNALIRIQKEGISPKFIRLERSLISGVLASGLPFALTALLAHTTSIVKNNLCAGYGDIEMAAYGIVLKADMLPLNIGMDLCRQGLLAIPILLILNYFIGRCSRMFPHNLTHSLSEI